MLFQNIERKLENIYIPQLITCGNNLLDSKKIFKRLVRIAKKESKLERTSKLPYNFGDIILSRRTNNEKFRSFVENLEKEGVRDEDIRWWWNKHDLERRIIEKIDDNIRLTAFVNNCKKGMSKAKAVENVRKSYPIYGDPKDISHTAGDNRPLPDELRNRINTYLEEKLKKSLNIGGKYTSFNAFIRKKIREGNL